MSAACQEIARRLCDEHDPFQPPTDLYADQFVIWHNYDEREIELTPQQLVVGAEMERAALGQVLSGLGYVDRKVMAAEDAVVVTQVMVGTLADGMEVRIPACHVSTVSDGRIVRTDVYMDSAPMQVLGKAFQDAGVTLGGSDG